MSLMTEHYYTSLGRQRAVFLRPDAETRFAVELQDGDEAVVEMTYDPPETVKRGQGAWEVFEGGLAGCAPEVTALRIDVKRVHGWVKLSVAVKGMRDGE